MHEALKGDIARRRSSQTIKLMELDGFFIRVSLVMVCWGAHTRKDTP